MRKALMALVGAAAVGLSTIAAAPAHASNEVRVKVDPLNWNWSGEVYKGKGSSRESAEFSVQADGGPQRVFTLDVGWNSEALIGVVKSTATAGDVSVPVGDIDVLVTNYILQKMGVKGPFLTNMSDLGRFKNFEKKTDPTTGGDYYEVLFGAARRADVPSTPDRALMNLHEVQDKGVSPEDCTVSKTLEPGDTLRTGDANDVVCVTVTDGDGSSTDPIKVDTGDGNDVVLIDGDTDAPVEVEAGRGNDVTVADTDAEVSVNGGDGHDAAVVDAGDTFTGGDGVDKAVSIAMTDEEYTKWMAENCTFGPYGDC